MDDDDDGRSEFSPVGGSTLVEEEMGGRIVGKKRGDGTAEMT